MTTNLLYGPVQPRLRRAASAGDPAVAPDVEGVWESLHLPDQEALLDLARAGRFGFAPTIRSHGERAGVGFAFVENTFMSLEMKGLIRPAGTAPDPVDSHWRLTGRGKAVCRQGEQP